MNALTDFLRRVENADAAQRFDMFYAECIDHCGTFGGNASNAWVIDLHGLRVVQTGPMTADDLTAHAAMNAWINTARRNAALDEADGFQTIHPDMSHPE